MLQSKIEASCKVELRYENRSELEIQKIMSVINDDEINEDSYGGYYEFKVERDRDYDYDGYNEPNSFFNFIITIKRTAGIRDDTVDVHEDFEVAKRIQERIKNLTGIE